MSGWQHACRQQGSGLPPLEAPIMIAEKHKLFFSFLSGSRNSPQCSAQLQCWRQCTFTYRERVSHEWVAACMQAAGPHHNVAHGCNAGGDGSDSHQRCQCNVEDLERGRHGVPLELQCTQDKLHQLISIRPASICGRSTAELGVVQCR